jgi:hypothetical protein
VKALANQLAAGEQNRFDKVVAIQEHVRGIKYNQLVPAPPAGQDGVDYFLFDAKEGYSDYHASALAVLLRAAGIPARVVAGYLPGVFDPEKQAFVVKEADAHGWTEVYFPSYGWISLEPVGGRPPLVMPRPSPLNGGGAGAVPTVEATAGPVRNDAITYGGEDEDPGTGEIVDLEPLPNEWGKGIPTFLMTVGGVALGLLVVSQVTVRLLARIRSPKKSYLWMGHIARLMGFGPRKYETASEYAYRLQDLVPQYAPRIQEIAYRYSLATFAHRREDEPLAPIPWGRMAWGLLKARFNRLQSRARQPLPGRTVAYGA